MQSVTASVDSLSGLYLHVRVLLGMVVGLGLTHLIRHFARIVDRPVRQKVYWVHMVWAVSMFVFLLHFWWWEFRLAGTVHWTFALYTFVTLYALLLYLLCAIIFPDSLEGHVDYREYFYSRRHWFFAVLAVVYLVDLGDTWIKGRAYFDEFGPEYIVRNVSYVVLCILAIGTRKAWFHGAFATLGLVYQLSWIARQFETL